MRQANRFPRCTMLVGCFALAFSGFSLLTNGAALAQESVPAMMNGLAAGLPALVANDAADGTTSYSLSLQILALMDFAEAHVRNILKGSITAFAFTAL